jgi:hypothetical protein
MPDDTGLDVGDQQSVGITTEYPHTAEMSVKGHIGTVTRANYHTPELGTPYSSSAEERTMNGLNNRTECDHWGGGKSSLSVEGRGR